MIKSTLVEILRTFNEDEQRRLIDFFRSPWCTPNWQSPEPLRLVSHIFDSLNHRRITDLDRAILYGHVFPGMPPVFNKLEKLFSTTLKSVRQFIHYEMFTRQCQPAQAYLLQAEFFREKGDSDECERIFEKLGTWQQKKNKWSHREFNLNWLIEHGRYDYKSEVYNKKDDQNLFRTLEALEELYLSERLFYTCMLLNINRFAPVLSHEDLATLISETEYPRNSKFFHSPMGILYRLAIRILTRNEPSEEEFESFYFYLNKHQNILPDDLYSHFESFAINHCVRHTSTPRFQAILFGLLKNRVEEGRNFVEGKISASEFQNVVKVGLLQGEYDWVWQFLQANRHNIAGNQHSEAYFLFNLATYWFYTGELDKALEVLLTTDYEEMQYKISAKILEIKILYELDSDILPARVDAAKIFFYREKQISEDKKYRCCRFADFMRRLIRPQTAVNPERIQKLLQELDDDPLIAELYWLREKLEQMLQKRRW